jgi:hypothetical protein
MSASSGRPDLGADPHQGCRPEGALVEPRVVPRAALGGTPTGPVGAEMAVAPCAKGSRPGQGAPRCALRVEHDGLAERLAARSSIDLVRRGAFIGFAGFIASGLTVKLGFDRWFSTRPTRFKGPPVFFFCALVLALVLVSIAAWYLIHARRRMRVEDAQFARMQELRSRLELDP